MKALRQGKPEMPIERQWEDAESVCLDRDHGQTLLCSCIRQGQEHQEVTHGALGAKITLLDPEPTALVTYRDEGIARSFGAAEDPQGRLRVYVSYGQGPEVFVHDIRELLRTAG